MVGYYHYNYIIELQPSQAQVVTSPSCRLAVHNYLNYETFPCTSPSCDKPKLSGAVSYKYMYYILCTLRDN